MRLKIFIPNLIGIGVRKKNDMLHFRLKFVQKCLSQRPRKVGAKYSGTGMAPDEQQQIQLSMDYDGKRDRWNGFDPDEHMRIVEEYAKVDLVSRVVGYFCVFMFILLYR